MEGHMQPLNHLVNVKIGEANEKVGEGMLKPFFAAYFILFKSFHILPNTPSMMVLRPLPAIDANNTTEVAVEATPHSM
jgi:hypothetical protein